MPKADKKIEVISIKQERVSFCVVGETPLIMNRLSEKAKREFLLPSRKKNQAERASIAKHDVIQEFRDSPHTLTNGPTLLAMPSTAFKGALRSVAVDMPGATKAQLGRLSYVEGEKIAIYGIPKLHMATVRQAGMAKTPDVRSRVIVPRWAAVVPIKYTVPMLNLKTINSLFQAAGLIIGVGDWRPEKGSGNFGTFRVVDEGDTEFNDIVTEGGRLAQEAGMHRADPYDAETEELLDWFKGEAGDREFKVAT